MMTYKTINELADRVHANAVEHGFYDNVEDRRAKLDQLEVLLATEIGEFVNADRKDRWFITSSLFAESELASMLDGEVAVADFADFYNERVKGTAEEELADIFIRALDTLGFLQKIIEPEDVTAARGKIMNCNFDANWRLAHKLYELCFYLANVPTRLVAMIELIQDFCISRGVNLDLHVRAKMLFNAQRPYRHDKKY